MNLDELPVGSDPPIGGQADQECLGLQVNAGAEHLSHVLQRATCLARVQPGELASRIVEQVLERRPFGVQPLLQRAIAHLQRRDFGQPACGRYLPAKFAT